MTTVNAEHTSVQNVNANVVATPTSGPSTGPVYPRKPVHMMMSPTTVDEFREEYGIDPILTTSNPIHLHPHLAHQRNWLEQRALKLCRKEFGEVLVCDVGSAARAARSDRNVHCLVPNFQPGDDQRFKECRDLSHLTHQETKVCRHPLQECDCAEFGALLFTHSAYYFDTEDFFQALLKTTTRTAYVIGHTFNESVGSFSHNEGGYRYIYSQDKYVIECRVKGNHHPYVHPPLLWDGVPYVDWDVYSLNIQIVEALGSTYLWRIEVVPRLARVEVSRTTNWDAQLCDPTYRGPIQVPGYDKMTKQSLAANDYMTIEVDRVYGYGPVLFAHTAVGVVNIPRGVVFSSATIAFGKPRNKATMLDIIHHMSNALKSTRLNEQEKLRALTIGSAFAFMCNVQNEVDVLNTVSGRFDGLNRLHETLLSLTPSRLWTLKAIIAFGLVGLVIVLVIWAEVPMDKHLAGWVSTGIWGCVTLISVATLLVARYRQTRAATTWSMSLFAEGRARNVDALAAPLLQVTYPMTREFVPAIDDPERGTLDYDVPDPTRRSLDAPPPEHLRTGGIVFGGAVPQAAHDCIDAERSGITNRVLVGGTVVTEDAFALYNSGLDAASMSLKTLEGKLNVTRNDFTNWLNSDKWGLSIKEKFMRYYAKCRDMTPYDTWHKLFVKVEKNKTADLDGQKQLKPRIISAPFEGVKVMTGPYISRIYSMVRDLWNGSPIPGTNGAILYCSGMTPDAIGRLVHAWIIENGGLPHVIGMSWDFSVYDSTLQNELLESRSQYKDFGMPETAYEWLARAKPGGMTKHGGMVKLTKKQALVLQKGKIVRVNQDILELSSGDMDTNLIGSIINAKAMCTFIPAEWKFLMLVCGDDNFLLTLRSCYSQDGVTTMENGLKDLGLRPTLIVSENFWDWEFCSKLFWFGKDRQTGESTMVLGPKPLRWLHRIGWNLTLPGQLNFRGAMISSQHDVQHIPLLRGYVTRGLQLTKGLRAIGKEHTEIKHVSKAYDCADENYIILRERYGLTIEHEIELMGILSKVESIPSVVQWPQIEKYERDE